MKRVRKSEVGSRNELEGARNDESSAFRIPHSEIEQALCSLAPRAAQLDRDRLMFLAGQAAVPQASQECELAADQSHQVDAVSSLGARWGWPVAFSAMTALAASLLLVLLNRPEPQVIERVVRVPVEVRRSVAEAADAPEQADRFVVDAARTERAEYQPPSGDSYLRLRNRALALGIDSWMDAVRSPGFASEERPASYRELRDSLLQ
ncbi:MAG TPA: hypothetical protein VHC19_08720 [Pirellulales bacterium]|nr:hypothetical protein [Pirellulales bacterium]